VFVEAVGSVYGKPLQGEQARCKVPTPAVAAGPLPVPGAAEAAPLSATDAPASGVRFAQSPSGASPASPAEPSPVSAPPALPARPSATARAAARPVNDGCDDSLYWTDKAGIRRIKPQCL